MRFLRLAKKNREVVPSSWESLYKKEIQREIRRRYSVDDEIAIIRQKDDKPQEFFEYNEYAEDCKRRVKSELGI